MIPQDCKRAYRHIAKSLRPAKNYVCLAACVQPQEAGEWKNVASHGAGIHKIALRFVCQDQIVNGQPYPSGPPWYMRVWGKCESTFCDWGEVAAKTLDGAGVYAVYSRGGVAHHVWAKVSRYRPGQLWVSTRVDSVNSKSSDDISQDWFIREESGDPNRR
jgi:hypothetical protein